MQRQNKEAGNRTVIIRVRSCCGTDIATGGGKRTTCTMGPHSAAHAHAFKLFGGRPFNLTALRESGTFRAELVVEGARL